MRSGASSTGAACNLTTRRACAGEFASVSRMRKFPSRKVIKNPFFVWFVVLLGFVVLLDRHQQGGFLVWGLVCFGLSFSSPSRARSMSSCSAIIDRRHSPNFFKSTGFLRNRAGLLPAFLFRMIIP